MIPVKRDIAHRAAISSLEDYRARYVESLEDPNAFWLQQAEHLRWMTKPTRAAHFDAHTAEIAWFEDGVLNASVNCLDRHLDEGGDHTALIWAKDEAGCYERISWRDLHRRTCRIANALRRLGVQKGDRVCLYMPMIPELAASMLACARIGAVHSIVFAGFSADALRDRLEDAGARVVITADEGVRGGKHIPLKAIVDKAAASCGAVTHVLVAKRTGAEVPMRAGRDLWLHELMAAERPTCPPEPMSAEDPLFILYTSGSTGKPKGLLHTTGGYLLHAALTHRYVFDLKPDDVHFCAADIGWITGHSYVVYGPLANGTTTVLFESVPTYPNAGRYWQVVDDLEVSTFYTAPTALRAIMRAGNEPVTRSSRKSLRVLGSVGEPINPEVWRWYHDVVGEARCAVVDTWWQTETGGIMISPLPGATPVLPGSATLPLFGVQPVLVDERGQRLEGNGVRGNLCLEGTWPGQARTIFGDHARYVSTYYGAYPGLYFTGDGCHRDEHGYYWITGRVDDVLTVSGHRLGTAEVESALVSHEAVAEAAVVGMPHDIKGQGILAYVLLHPNTTPSAALTKSLVHQVRETLSPIAAPDRVLMVPALPKTRSGKIMRRILRKIGERAYDQLGDTSTLADPSVVDEIIRLHQTT